MERSEKQSWEKDFVEFATSTHETVPAHLTDRVHTMITEALHPSALNVFAKLASITFMVGLITLLFCPQFGLSFSSSMGLMHYLMPFGNSVCMVGCGGLFLGSSVFVSSMVLRPEEILKLKATALLQLSSLSVLSLGAFVCAGGQIVISLGLIWALGAIVAGGITLETGWALRKRAVAGI